MGLQPHWAKEELLALMETIALVSEIDANRLLLGDLQMKVQAKLWPLQEPGKTNPPSSEVQYLREFLFPLTRGEYRDSGLQMKDLLYVARKSFVTFCPRAWAQGQGFPMYDLLKGFSRSQGKRAMARCAAIEALLPLTAFEWLAHNFKEERRFLSVDMLHSPTTLSVIHEVERRQIHVLFSEKDLGDSAVQAHVATLGDAWTAVIAGDTLSAKHIERKRMMQRESLPTAWRQEEETDVRKVIVARRIVQNHPEWWPEDTDGYPGLNVAEYKKAMKDLRRARRRLEGRLKVRARQHKSNAANENHRDLA